LINSKLTNLRRSVRDWGLRDTIERHTCKVGANLLRRGLHKIEVPTLSTLCASAESVFTNPDELLKGVFTVDDRILAELRQEYSRARSEIVRRYEVRSLPFPRQWAVEEGSSFLLYAITRLSRPSTVLETGVANGHSSFFILNALNQNATPAKLHSVDVSPLVGQLVELRERTRWDLHLLSPATLKKDFGEVLFVLPSIDLMIQDSDHSYRWTDFELEAALPRMAPSGLLLCDDANLSFAVIDFCRAHTLKLILLVDARKVFAVIPLGGPNSSC
jgi:predicted O-methyltransferase YrrM